MKTQSGLFLLIVILLGVTFCVKEDPFPVLNEPSDSEINISSSENDSIDNSNLNSVTPEVIVNISFFNCTGAMVFFNLVNDDKNPPIEGGIYLGTTANPTTTNPDNSICYTQAMPIINGHKYRSEIDQLQPATLYHLRAYVTTASGTYYSEDLSFTTNSPPTITTAEVINITSTTAKVGGNMTSTGNSFVVEKGICYSMNPDPVAYGDDPYIEQEVQSTEGTGEFKITLANLVPNTRYYVRSFVGVMTGTYYGDQLFVYGDAVSFITKP